MEDLIACGVCGEKNRPSYFYCTECGNRLLIEQPPPPSPPPPALPAVTVRVSGKSVTVTSEQFIVGRGLESPVHTLFALHPNVSREHALLTVCSDGALLVEDRSLNGTFVNEMRLPAHEGHALRASDRVRLARNCSIEFSVAVQSAAD